MTLAGDGWRARIGVVVPSVNTVIEPWYSRVVPPGVTVHTSRMLLAPQVTRDSVVEMDRRDGLRAVRQLASCAVDALAYCCTASSVLQGPAYDAELIATIEREVNIPATTVTASILCALEALDVRSVVIVSPYTEEIDRAERHFFEQAGISVLAGHGMAISESLLLAAPGPGEIYRAVRQVWRPEAQALLLTCADFRGHEVIQALETDLGRPVVTSTQAPLWRALRLAGVRDSIHGYGRLLTL